MGDEVIYASRTTSQIVLGATALSKGAGKRYVAVEEVEVGGVARLDRGYRRPRGQQICALYVGDRTVVGLDACVLEYLSCAHRARYVRNAEVVIAGRHRLATEALDHADEWPGFWPNQFIADRSSCPVTPSASRANKVPATTGQREPLWLPVAPPAPSAPGRPWRSGQSSKPFNGVYERGGRLGSQRDFVYQ